MIGRKTSPIIVISGTASCHPVAQSGFTLVVLTDIYSRFKILHCVQNDTVMDSVTVLRSVEVMGSITVLRLDDICFIQVQAEKAVSYRATVLRAAFLF